MERVAHQERDVVDRRVWASGSKQKIQVSLLLTSISNEFLLMLPYRTLVANLTGVKFQGILVKARIKQTR